LWSTVDTKESKLIGYLQIEIILFYLIVINIKVKLLSWNRLIKNEKSKQK